MCLQERWYAIRMAPLDSPRFCRADTLWSTSRARLSATLLHGSLHALLYCRYLPELKNHATHPSSTRRMKCCAHSQADSQVQPSHHFIPYTTYKTPTGGTASASDLCNLALTVSRGLMRQSLGVIEQMFGLPQTW